MPRLYTWHLGQSLFKRFNSRVLSPLKITNPTSCPSSWNRGNILVTNTSAPPVCKDVIIWRIFNLVQYINHELSKFTRIYQNYSVFVLLTLFAFIRTTHIRSFISQMHHPSQRCRPQPPPLNLWFFFCIRTKTETPIVNCSLHFSKKRDIKFGHLRIRHH